jgi:hypothetical protein
LSEQPHLRVIPVSLKGANEFVALHHRHHKPVIGHKFSVGVLDDSDALRGVAIIGRPVSRNLDDGFTLEVNRVATDGVPNACSALYGAARRAAKALGYRRMVTYILESEPGTSLKGAGWKAVATTSGGSWNCESRPRVDKAPTCSKVRWEAELGN